MRTAIRRAAILAFVISILTASNGGFEHSIVSGQDGTDDDRLTALESRMEEVLSRLDALETSDVKEPARGESSRGESDGLEWKGNISGVVIHVRAAAGRMGISFVGYCINKTPRAVKLYVDLNAYGGDGFPIGSTIFRVSLEPEERMTIRETIIGVKAEDTHSIDATK